MALVTKKRVGVLMGGLSSEREVSLASGSAVLQALQAKGYDVVGIDVGRDIAERLHGERIEIVFNALHGNTARTAQYRGCSSSWASPTRARAFWRAPWG